MISRGSFQHQILYDSVIKIKYKITPNIILLVGKKYPYFVSLEQVFQNSSIAKPYGFGLIIKQYKYYAINQRNNDNCLLETP